MPRKRPCLCWRGSYYCMLTRPEVSYDPKFLRNRVHRLSTCLPRFEWFFLIVHPSEGGRLYLNVVLCPLLFENHARSKIRRSDTILSGTPCCLTISLMYKLANCSEKKVPLMAKKCAALVSLSTVTQTLSCCLMVFGILIIKSMVMCSHFHIGIGKGCSSPPGF